VLLVFISFDAVNYHLDGHFILYRNKRYLYVKEIIHYIILSHFSIGKKGQILGIKEL
jgi:hypothetical protein